eukprot:COSAG01_NODE_497_length_16267_cov_5.357558_10_plen_278_part_00
MTYQKQQPSFISKMLARDAESKRRAARDNKVDLSQVLPTMMDRAAKGAAVEQWPSRGDSPSREAEEGPPRREETAEETAVRLAAERTQAERAAFMAAQVGVCASVLRCLCLWAGGRAQRCGWCGAGGACRAPASLCTPALIARHCSAHTTAAAHAHITTRCGQSCKTRAAAAGGCDRSSRSEQHANARSSCATTQDVRPCFPCVLFGLDRVAGPPRVRIIQRWSACSFALRRCLRAPHSSCCCCRRRVSGSPHDLTQYGAAHPTAQEGCRPRRGRCE